MPACLPASLSIVFLDLSSLLLLPPSSLFLHPSLHPGRVGEAPGAIVRDPVIERIAMVCDPVKLKP